MSSNQENLCSIEENIVSQERLDIEKNLDLSEALDKKTSKIL
jgi:hypothetical protein